MHVTKPDLGFRLGTAFRRFSIQVPSDTQRSPWQPPGSAGGGVAML